MFVTDTLLVDSNSFDGEHTISGFQPACVELIIWHHKEEYHTQKGGQAAVDQKHDLPRCYGGTVFAGTNGDAVRYETSEDLTEPVETEPDPYPGALFLLGVPLRSEQSEPRCDCCFEDAEEDCRRSCMLALINHD